MNKFKISLITRTLLLSASIFLLFFLLFDTGYKATLVLLIFIIAAQIYSIFRLVDTTNRELAKFLQSIKHSDFSRSFLTKKFGPSFDELGNSFNNVIKQFQKTRSEKEENFQYLQTVVKHIGNGLISFSENGHVEIINEAAKNLLGISEIININNLNSVNQELVNILNIIRAGEKYLVRINEGKKEMQLSVFASEFKLRDKKYTLVTLQDIKNELERERLAKEMEIAQNVQLRLLPGSNPSVPGYDIAGICLPAKEVGGDYYDFVDLGNNKMGIVIGDVSGKGLPASIYMTLTKGIFQSYVGINPSPKDVLINLNRLLYKNVDKGIFVTMIYAVLDYESHKLTLARAGHEPAIMYSSNKNETGFIQPSGIGLSLDAGGSFVKAIEEKTYNLNVGDRFLFYTDGCSDSKNDSDSDYGRESILNFVQNSSSLNGELLIKDLCEDIVSFSAPSPQFDDMTLISLKRIM